MNRAHLSAHPTAEDAGARLADFYVGGPTPFTAHLYEDGRPATEAASIAAREAAAEAVVARARTQ